MPCNIYHIFAFNICVQRFNVSFLFRAGTGGPSVVAEGGDALLTCVVMNPYANETVIWRKGQNEILSAGKNRVTGDRRISILHDESKYVRLL